MDYDARLKLQAYLDGELSEGEASKVANWLAQDREAAVLLEELRNTRGALAGFEAGIQFPESREFFWSKVQREIQRLEIPASKPAPTLLFGLFRRFLVPAAALAVVLVGGVVLTWSNGPLGRSATAGIETALTDAGAFTYHDDSVGTTLVWLSYPAENEIADDDDEMGTID
jgi:anti-sigma factor RsiW